jgi:hypothetical protein
MKKFLVSIFFIALPVCAQEFGQVGTSGAQLLKISFDPRASALGYAAASIVDNASALYTNPAGIEAISTFDLAFAYVPWFADIQMVSAAAALRIPHIGVVGIQAAGFSTEEEITTVEMENGTGRMYSIKNYTFGLGFSRKITDRLALGLQGKLIFEMYYGHHTTGIAFDIGSRYDLGFSGSWLALSLQNFGPELSPLSGNYLDYSDANVRKGYTRTPLPVMFRASFSIEPMAGDFYRLRVIADLVHPNDNKEHYNLGTELLLYDAVALRGGLKINYDDESFAAGIGLRGAEMLGQNVRLDYSYEYFKTLPSIHKVAVGFAL